MTHPRCQFDDAFRTGVHYNQKARKSSDNPCGNDAALKEKRSGRIRVRPIGREKGFSPRALFFIRKISFVLKLVLLPSSFSLVKW